MKVNDKIAIAIIAIVIIAAFVAPVVLSTYNYFPEYGASKTILKRVRALGKEVDKVKSIDFYAYNRQKGNNLELRRINDKDVIQSFLWICKRDLYVENKSRGGNRYYDKVVINFKGGQLTILNCWSSKEQGGDKIVSRAIRSRHGEFKAFAAAVHEGKYGAVRIRL